MVTPSESQLVYGLLVDPSDGTLIVYTENYIRKGLDQAQRLQAL